MAPDTFCEALDDAGKQIRSAAKYNLTGLKVGPYFIVWYFLDFFDFLFCKCYCQWKIQLVTYKVDQLMAIQNQYCTINS